MDIGVIGTGRIGKRHAEILANHAWVKSISVYDPRLDTAWIKQHGLTACHSLADFWQQPLDAVVIASPTDCHLSHIQQAVEARCAILCEKPIGLDIAEIESTLELVDKHNLLLQIGFNRRFDNHFAALRKAIQHSANKPQVIKITSRDPQCPPADYLKSSGGIFIDMTIHDFDMACFLADALPIEVQAMGSCTVDKQLEQYDDIDTAVVLLRFDNGAMGIIENCRQAVYGYDQRAEVYNHQQQWWVDNPRQDGVECWQASGQSSTVLQPFFLSRYQQAYQDQMHAFLLCVQQQKPSLVTGLDGLHAVKMAHAAKESVRLGRPVVI